MSKAMDYSHPSVGDILVNEVHEALEKGEVLSFTLIEVTEKSSTEQHACLTKNGVGTAQTQFGLAVSTKGLNELVLSQEFWDDSSPRFHALKNLSNFFPVRTKMTNFIRNVCGWVPDFKERLVHYETRYPSTENPNKKLAENGDDVLRRYTEGKNWYCTRINMLMSLDLIKGEYALYAKDLKACIGWQTPKYSGLVYRGALHSALEIFIMSFKKTFYLPGFVSTSMDPSKILFNPCPDSADPTKSYHNVIFEIDTRDYPNFSTIIQPQQLKYTSTEEECLISCYNIYTWQGFRVVKWGTNQIDVGIVSLKLENYEKLNNFQSGAISAPSGTAVDNEWLIKKGEIVRCRNVRPDQLILCTTKMWDSYSRINDEYPLTWLNFPYKVVGEGLERNFISDIGTYPTTKSGKLINGLEFFILEHQQQEGINNDTK